MRNQELTDVLEIQNRKRDIEVKQENVIYSTLLRATGKLSAVSFALSNDDHELSNATQWGLCYIVDEVVERLQTIIDEIDKRDKTT